MSSATSCQYALIGIIPSPLLDIKPFVPGFDTSEAVRTGWRAGKTGAATVTQADRRFT